MLVVGVYWLGVFVRFVSMVVLVMVIFCVDLLKKVWDVVLILYVFLFK